MKTCNGRAFVVRLALPALVLLASIASPIRAQSPEASLSGIISDPQGGVVAGAQVSALNRSTGIKTSVVTNASGAFVIRPLPIGSYQVLIEHAGFKRFDRSGLTLTTGQSFELNVTLEVGSVTESVQ